MTYGNQKWNMGPQTRQPEPHAYRCDLSLYESTIQNFGEPEWHRRREFTSSSRVPPFLYSMFCCIHYYYCYIHHFGIGSEYETLRCDAIATSQKSSRTCVGWSRCLNNLHIKQRTKLRNLNLMKLCGEPWCRMPRLIFSSGENSASCGEVPQAGSM